MSIFGLKLGEYMTNLNTVDTDSFLEVMAKSNKKLATPEVMDEIKEIVSRDDSLDGLIQDKIISFSSVMKSGRYKSVDYIRAVQFCSYTAIGDSQIDAYRKTFPDRVAKKKSDSTIQSSASIYASGELVQKIMSQSMVPAHIMFNSERFKAISILSDLMVNSDNERIRMESADKMLGHIAPPKEAKLEIDVTTHHDGIDELNSALTRLANQQKEMLDGGHTDIKSIAESKIVDAEVIDV